MDTSKQTFGAGIAHLANLVISIHFARGDNTDEVSRQEMQAATAAGLTGA